MPNHWLRRGPRRAQVLVAGLTLLCLPAICQAEPLTLNRFLQAVMDHNPGVQRILAQQPVAAGQLQAAQAVDDLSLTLSGGLNYSQPDVLLGIEPNRAYGALLGASLERVYSATGTRLGARYGNLYTSRSPGATAVGVSYYQPSLTLSLTQPLLNNAGGIQDRLDIDLGRQRYQLSRLLAQEQLESYVTRLAALYLDWYLSYREMTISEEVYRQSLEQEKLVQLKVKRQVAEPYELLRAQEIREDFFARWQQASGLFEGLRYQLVVQMRGGTRQTDAVSPPIPVNPRSATLLVAASSAPDYLANDSRLQAVLALLQGLETTRLKALDNRQKPSLDLGLNYTRHGVDSNLGDAHTGSLEQDDVGLQLNYRYPLGNRAARGAVAAQQAAVQQVSADTAQQLRDAQAALGDLLAQQIRLTTALQSADRKVVLAAKKLAEEARLYAIGQLDLFELLQDQTAQLETRLNRERLGVALYKVRLGAGELLDQNLRGLKSPGQMGE